MALEPDWFNPNKLMTKAAFGEIKDRFESATCQVNSPETIGQKIAENWLALPTVIGVSSD